MSSLPEHLPTCDLCGVRSKNVRFLPSEGTWLCRNSRACSRRFNLAQAEAEAESARWEPTEPVRDDDIPF